ncbi:MAG: peptidase domain-containing ABC transporter [Chitinophagaceae bacterium]|nr:peptidase domain-containing ABC transporter [Chitinophagaceae bacterium]
MKFHYFHQPDSMDCGPACLQMIAKHYGKSIGLQSLREISQIGKEGVNMLGISEAAESIGFRTQAVKLSFDSLTKDVMFPCILHWNQYHFVVLYKIKNKKLYVADPAHGLAIFNKEEFLERWISTRDEKGIDEGIALLLEPGPKFYVYDDDFLANTNEKDELLAFKNIFNYLLPYKKLIFQLFLGLGIASMLQLVLPFLAQSVVDVGVNTANIHFVYVVLLAQAALVIGRLSVEFVRSWLLLHISTRINISILTDFLIKLMRLPLSFFDSKKTGDILQRMNDHQRIESFLTGSSINVLFSLANLFIFSMVLAIFNVQIFSVFVATSTIYSIWIFLFLKKRRILDYKRFDIASREQANTIQLVQSMQEIKLNGIEKNMRWGWERLQAKLFKLSIKGLALNQWQQSGASLINESKNIFITFLSAKAVIDGQMTLGSMLAVQYMIGQLNSPIEQMINFVQTWQNAKISMERLNEIHGMEDEEPTDRHLLQELPIAFMKQLIGGKKPLSAALEQVDINARNYLDQIPNNPVDEMRYLDESWVVFSNVSFTYPGAGNNPVLKDITLKIPKGKTTAIVGLSGSGKTTLLKLLLKYYEPQKGDIRLNNTLLSTISHKVWRAHCSAVMQESFIFSESIAKNIAVGEDFPCMKKLQHAAQVANIDEFIESLPLGFNTKIGAEGAGISMGQKQRMLIARAVYRDPEFIFLDEATNSLDANNELIIVQNLGSFLHGKTVVVVAHRLSTVRHADQIIVLNNGEVTEHGTHQELVNLKGKYFTLIKNQLELGE